ncbi:MAG: hemerythrin domain-containing protein [Microbacterium sp.]|nr:hemerythrin domain-containing protein [Microbacterium sp.]
MDADRLTAWDAELRRAHTRLRSALAATREALTSGAITPDAASDLALFCIGFCTALDGHHRAEDRSLFPALRAARPDLSGAIDKLEQDHSMLSHLLGALRNAVESGEDDDAIGRHLDGIGAIMESHFRFEEREILEPLRTLTVDGTVPEVLGPL